MMTDWEREEFMRRASGVADDALAHNASIRGALAPLFQQALREHPEEEARLLALFDRLTSRPVL